MDAEIDRYIESHISPEPAYLKALDRRVHTSLVYSRMCSGHAQGRLLKMLTSMINPRRVLELGTYAGYSALCMAEGLLRDDAHIHTVEIYDELEDFIRRQFEASPFSSKITLHIGDALEIVPLIDEQWDMVFIDANKRHYPEYYNLLIDRLSPGGYILADNTLWYGKVAEENEHEDAQTRGIRLFNEMVRDDDRVEVVIVPLRDGLSLIRKKF